jgi:fatty-acyl-CoA synthase
MIEYPDVMQAAAISIADECWGERPITLAVARPGSSSVPAGMRAKHQDCIARWCIPEDVLLVELLPVDATDEMQKNTLWERYGQPFSRRR